MNKKEMETRGRKRDPEIDKLVEQIEAAYMKNRLPLIINTTTPKKLSPKLRLSLSMKEMQEELGVNFKLMAGEGQLVVALRR
jgi:hypothetical protein